MKAIVGRSELRIGNLFNPDQPTEVEDWMLLTESKIIYEPIPLTEEWLKRFGFIRLSNGNFGFNKEGYYDEDDFKFIVSDERSQFNGSPDSGCFYWNGMSQLPDINIKYVHQLQNLYHALTGTELTVLNDRR